MGKDQEKSGFLSSNWMTIVLIVVLIVLAVILILIIKSPKQFDLFKGCGKKKEVKPDLLQPTMNQKLQNSSSQIDLVLTDNGLKIASELSWQRPLS
jgi:hypothetical protein